MRKHSMLFTILIGVLLWGGCAVPPSWTQYEEDAGFYSEKEVALYGVGRGGAEFADARRAIARINARSNLAEAKREHVTELLERFQNENTDWFDGEEFQREIDNIAGRVNELTPFPVELIEHWEDTRYLPWEDTGGRAEGRGDVYALAKQQLEPEINDAIYKAVSESLEAHQKRLLKTDSGTVLDALEEKLGR